MTEPWGEYRAEGRAECCADGGLRAYLDRELPRQLMTEIAVHLGACAQCHARYNEFASRAARVAAWMDTLQISTAAAPVRRKAVRPLAVAALALAATVGVFALLPKGPAAPKPVAAPHVSPARAVIQQARAKPTDRLEAAPGRANSPKRVKPSLVEDYLALDDEPIDTGVVMRVAFDGTGVQADVIFDAEGRPRAIRTVK